MSMTRNLHLGCGERLSSPCLDVLDMPRRALTADSEGTGNAVMERPSSSSRGAQQEARTDGPGKAE